MKEIQQQQQEQYKFEEFEEHIHLYNVVPAGDGNALTLLKNIADGMQGGYFEKKPSILIVGEAEEVRMFAIAFANTLCSEDIRFSDPDVLISVRDQIEFFNESINDTIHIINDVEDLRLNKTILVDFLKKRETIFNMTFDGRIQKYSFLNGMLILTSKDIRKVSKSLLNHITFKVVIQPYTKEQLKMITQQRLRFCGVKYDDEVLNMIVEYSNDTLSRIIELLKICLLLINVEGQDKLTLDIVQETTKLSCVSIHEI